jgi:hypothetical protein
MQLNNMKNIHIILTDKPSRLVYNRFLDKYHLFNTNNNEYQSVNIYITNSEEIKEGDLVYCRTENRVLISNVSYSKLDDRFKIILTTDIDLIKDGVQAIDNEFLEWFVKNPSCEFVEVENTYFTGLDRNFVGYKIIIPKEEPKQETLDESKLRQLFKNRSNCYADAEDVVQAMDENCFIETIKEWQAKNTYSEEEVIDSIKYTIDNFFNGKIAGLNSKEIFEQFKKK